MKSTITLSVITLLLINIPLFSNNNEIDDGYEQIRKEYSQKIKSEDIEKKALGIEAIISGQTGISTKSNNNQAETTSSIENNSDTFYDVATYNLILKHEKEFNHLYNGNVIAINSEITSKNYDAEQARLEYLRQQEKTLQQEQEKEQIWNLSGYCTIPQDLEVERMQEYSILDCQFDENDLGIKDSKMFASFIPIYDKLALIGQPVYIRLSHRKIPIQNGVILTIDQTNLNLASFVNDVKIKNLLADMAIKVDDIAYASTLDYMAQLRNSKTTEEMAIVPNSDGTDTIVKTSNTETIDKETYFTMAGIQFASSFIRAIGSYYQDNNYPLYRVSKYTQFYVDFNIKTKRGSKYLIDYHKEDYKNITTKKSTYFTSQKPRQRLTEVLGN